MQRELSERHINIIEGYTNKKTKKKLHETKYLDKYAMIYSGVEGVSSGRV